MSRRGWLLFAAMSAIWGMPYLLIKIAVEVFPPASLVLLRTGIAAVLLLPFAVRRGQLRALWPYRRALVVFAVVELAVPWFLLSSAEQRLSSSLSGLLVAAVPLVAAALGWLSGTDRPDLRRIAGLTVGLVGVGALAGLDVGARDAVALVEMAVVVVTYAVGPFILARHLHSAPALGVITASLALTALAYLPVGVAQLPNRWPEPSVVWAVLVLAVVCTALAFLLFFALIEEVGPVRAPVITYVNPAVAVALGVLVLDEPFTVGIGVGFGLILAGSVLATARTRTPAGPAGVRDATDVSPAAPSRPATSP